MCLLWQAQSMQQKQLLVQPMQTPVDASLLWHDHNPMSMEKEEETL